MLELVKKTKTSTAATIATLFLGLVIATNANAALNAYLTLEGETQGLIEGSSTVAPHEGKIIVHGYSHTNGDGPNWRDCKEGDSSHEPLMIMKERDLSTTRLYTAYSTGESLMFHLEFYDPSASGAEEHTFSINLVNARIVSIEQVMLNNKNPDFMQYPVQEKVYFVYDAIERVFEDGAITSVDAWDVNCGK